MAFDICLDLITGGIYLNEQVSYCKRFGKMKNDIQNS
jgi:hypothetical protein